MQQTVAAQPQASPIGKVVGASLIGTTIEWYDFFVYGTAAALVFNKLFFPKFDPLVGTLLAFLTYALGFGARPLGGIVFGHFGDRLGRKSMLVITLMMMGIGTFLIGVLPTYATIGSAAPVLLVLLRLVQGFALGGEWGGAVLMAAEYGESGKRGLWASVPQAGVPLGNLSSVAVLSLMSAIATESQFLTWGWRVPFLLSAVLVIIGLWIRLTIMETPVFRVAHETEREVAPPSPLLDVVRNYWREVLIAMGARFADNVCYYIWTVFSITYILHLKGSRGLVLNALLVASGVHLLAIPFWGWLSDRIGRRPLYLLGAVGVGIWGFVFFALLDTKTPAWVTLAVTGGLVFHAAMYGPQASFFSELFRTRCRYSGASVGYQLASIFAGSLAPIIAVALLAAYKSSAPISLYLLGGSIITVVAVLLARETRGADLTATRPAAGAEGVTAPSPAT